MKVHVLVIDSTIDDETTTEVIGVYYDPFVAEEEGDRLLALKEYEADSYHYYSYESRVLQTEVK